MSITPEFILFVQLLSITAGLFVVGGIISEIYDNRKNTTKLNKSDAL